MTTWQYMPLIENREDLLAVLRMDLLNLRENFGVTRLALYGSFARGEAGPRSDVDLLVETDEPLGLKFIALARHLEELTGKKVDLATESANGRVEWTVRSVRTPQPAPEGER